LIERLRYGHKQVKKKERDNGAAEIKSCSKSSGRKKGSFFIGRKQDKGIKVVVTPHRGERMGLFDFEFTVRRNKTDTQKGMLRNGL